MMVLNRRLGILAQVVKMNLKIDSIEQALLTKNLAWKVSEATSLFVRMDDNVC